MFGSSLIPSTPDTPKMVRASQLAKWLNISESCVKSWVKKGYLPEPTRLGPHTQLFNVDVVRKKLEELETQEAETIPLICGKKGRK